MVGAVAAVLAISGCSGDKFTSKDETSSGGSNSGGSGGSGAASNGSGASPGSGGTAPAGFNCPLNAPVPNANCQVPGLTCSYGDDPRPSCRPHFQCSGDKWISLHQGVCSGDPTCPASAPTAGSECDSLDQMCAYPDEDIFCGCPECEGFCPVRPWICSETGTAPCPPALPNDGTPCDHEAANCDYGHCQLDDAIPVICAAGRWTWALAPCP